MDLNKGYSLLYAYAVLLGFIYSYAYWDYVNINIIMYINVFDLIKFSLRPLLMIIIPLIVVVMSIDFLFFNNQPETYTNTDYNLIGARKKFFICILLTLISLALLILYMQGKIPYVTYVGLTASVPLYIFVNNNKMLFFINIHNKFIKYAFLYIFLLLPWITYDLGIVNSKNRLQCSGCNGEIIYKDTLIRGTYLGHINTYFFIKKPNEKFVYVVSLPDIIKLHKDTHIMYK